jgi:hypothetical protein
MRIYLSPDVVVDEQEPVIPVGNRHTIWNVFAPAKFPNRAHFFHTAVLLRIARPRSTANPRRRFVKRLRA